MANPYVAEHVNGVNADSSMSAARQMIARAHHDSRLRAIKPANTAFVSDRPVAENSLAEPITKALAGSKTQQKLQQSAQRRSADHIAYVEAHLRIHDVVDSVQHLSVSEHTNPELRDAETVVSVGAATERNFYAARMACRQYGVNMPGATAKSTAQIFTKHSIAPYLYSLVPNSDDPPITDSGPAIEFFNAVEGQRLSRQQQDILYPWLLLSEVERAIETFGEMPAEQICRNVQVTTADVDYWHPSPNIGVLPSIYLE